MDAGKNSDSASAGVTIGQLASLAGVHVETIRYYQRRGMLECPQRAERGRRRYPREALERLRFIKRAQQLGFTLREIADLLKLDDIHCAEARAIAERRLQHVRAQLHELRSMEHALKEPVKTCRSAGGKPCAIIKAIGQG